MFSTHSELKGKMHSRMWFFLIFHFTSRSAHDDDDISELQTAVARPSSEQDIVAGGRKCLIYTRHCDYTLNHTQ